MATFDRQLDTYGSIFHGTNVATWKLFTEKSSKSNERDNEISRAGTHGFARKRKTMISTIIIRNGVYAHFDTLAT